MHFFKKKKKKKKEKKVGSYAFDLHDQVMEEQNINVLRESRKQSWSLDTA